MSYDSHFFLSAWDKSCDLSHNSRILDQMKTTLPERIYNWGAGNVYLLVLSSCKVNVAENPIAVMGL